MLKITTTKQEIFPKPEPGQKQATKTLIGYKVTQRIEVGPRTFVTGITMNQAGDPPAENAEIWFIEWAVETVGSTYSWRFDKNPTTRPKAIARAVDIDKIIKDEKFGGYLSVRNFFVRNAELAEKFLV